MKAKWLLALAGLFVLFLNSCDPTEELAESISISPSETSYTFPAEGGQYEIELTCTLDWALQGYDGDVAAWLSITPTSGSGSSTAQTVTIEAMPNDSYSRSASITFYGNILNYVTVTFTQEGALAVEEGEGTAESPYSVAQALALIDSEGWYSTTDGGTYSNEVYVKGIISIITEVAPTYGNATYLISDDGTTSNELTVYRGYYLNSASFTSEDQIKVGDEVVVAGQLTLFYSTYEFTTGNYIYSLNGETGDGDTESNDGPTSATQVTIAEFLEKEVNTTDWYELTGTITSIANTSYGNFYMEDSTGSVFVYGLVAEYANGSNDQSFSSIGLSEGDIVTIWTLRSQYNGEAQAGGTPPAIYITHTQGSGDSGDNDSGDNDPGSDVAPTDGSVTLTFPDDNNANNKVNGYEDIWNAQSGDYWFSIAYFNNYNWNGWTYIRCGHRTTAYTAYIVNTTAMPELSSIELSVGDRFDSEYITLTLEIYSDASLATKVCDDISPTGEYTTNSTLTYEIPADYRAANMYYKLVFDCQASGGSRNGFFELEKIDYIAAE